MLGSGVVGGAVVGGVIGALTSKDGNAGIERLDPLPTAALSQIRETLSPDRAAQVLEEARRCRVPLARVAVWHSPGTRGGAISIISGEYRSPSFTLTPVPRLVAIPYPSAYSTGSGILTFIGDARKVNISLRPGAFGLILKGSLHIPVWWNPVKGCP